jgi:hypothetical protein
VKVLGAFTTKTLFRRFGGDCENQDEQNKKHKWWDVDNMSDVDTTEEDEDDHDGKRKHKRENLPSKAKIKNHKIQKYNLLIF